MTQPNLGLLAGAVAVRHATSSYLAYRVKPASAVLHSRQTYQLELVSVTIGTMHVTAKRLQLLKTLHCEEKAPKMKINCEKQENTMRTTQLGMIQAEKSIGSPKSP